MANPASLKPRASSWVSVADIDRHYGVVPINPAEGLYAVQVKESSIRNDGAARGDYRGPFSKSGNCPARTHPASKEALSSFWSRLQFCLAGHMRALRSSFVNCRSGSLERPL